jgi:hypothetical protein
MCKYCDVSNKNGKSTLTLTDNGFGDFPVSCGIVKLKKDDDFFNIKAGIYYLDVSGEDDIFVEIKYCPMCSRRLSD